MYKSNYININLNLFCWSLSYGGYDIMYTVDQIVGCRTPKMLKECKTCTFSLNSDECNSYIQENLALICIS